MEQTRRCRLQGVKAAPFEDLELLSVVYVPDIVALIIEWRIAAWYTGVLGEPAAPACLLVKIGFLVIICPCQP